MAVFGLSMMLRKTKELSHCFHDVDEKKGERRLARFFSAKRVFALLAENSLGRENEVMQVDEP